MKNLVRIKYHVSLNDNHAAQHHEQALAQIRHLRGLFGLLKLAKAEESFSGISNVDHEELNDVFESVGDLGAAIAENLYADVDKLFETRQVKAADKNLPPVFRE